MKACLSNTLQFTLYISRKSGNYLGLEDSIVIALSFKQNIQSQTANEIDDMYSAYLRTEIILRATRHC
jgi:hypothetical protein